MIVFYDTYPLSSIFYKCELFSVSLNGTHIETISRILITGFWLQSNYFFLWCGINWDSKGWKEELWIIETEPVGIHKRADFFTKSKLELLIIQQDNQLRDDKQMLAKNSSFIQKASRPRRQWTSVPKNHLTQVRNQTSFILKGEAV